jgi:hypothetical protein
MIECGYRHVELSNVDRMPTTQHRKKPTPGFSPNQTNTNQLLTTYYLALRNCEMLNRSEPALADMLNFGYDAKGAIVHGKERGADPDAARDNHGDQVIADALSWRMVEALGRLASKQTPAAVEVPPEDNILTYAGRQALRERQTRARERFQLIGGWLLSRSSGCCQASPRSAGGGSPGISSSPPSWPSGNTLPTFSRGHWAWIKSPFATSATRRIQWAAFLGISGHLRLGQ